MFLNVLVSVMFLLLWAACIVFVYFDIEGFGHEKFEEIGESPRIWLVVASLLMFPIGFFAYLLLVRGDLEKLKREEETAGAVDASNVERDEEIARLKKELAEARGEEVE